MGGWVIKNFHPADENKTTFFRKQDYFFWPNVKAQLRRNILFNDGELQKNKKKTNIENNEQ